MGLGAATAALAGCRDVGQAGQPTSGPSTGAPRGGAGGHRGADADHRPVRVAVADVLGGPVKR
ncbi:hypothetical protein OOK41_16275 [Micromonospora sp. NBC_01655]|uniref:hypothetical protein n=1 Tax=Micromonospora sp. NBC_01655 TaxID=2975983 RepID=UPI00225148BD|nr:hypothetical protein [Micromonospora sp. NBC_01655]MCX4471846.1 hypothetical protein [Micromonospora sp. NBC_01655]